MAKEAMMEERPVQVGAPTLTYHPPRSGTAEGCFDRWVTRRRDFVEGVLANLTDRWAPLASFIVINFDHPEFGPAGAMVVFDPTVDMRPRQARLKRVNVIPMAELAEYVPKWKIGETVLTRLQDMSATLQKRYTGSLMRWSLNVPIFAGSRWIGVIGAAAGAEGMTDRAVASFETAAELLEKEFSADSAWERFSADMDAPRLVAVPYTSGMGEVSGNE